MVESKNVKYSRRKSLFLNFSTLKLFHPILESNLKVLPPEFVCHDCDVLFVSEEELKNHDFFVHTDSDVSKLIKCSFTLPIVHQNVSDCRQKRVIGDDYFKLDLRFTSDVELGNSDTEHLDTKQDANEIHRDTRETNLPVLEEIEEGDSEACFYCDICGNCFNSGSSLDKHIHEFHPRRHLHPPHSIECVRCPHHLFQSFSYLQNHLNCTHRDYVNIECHECFALFKNAVDLVEHYVECKVGNVKTNDHGQGDASLEVSFSPEMVNVNVKLEFDESESLDGLQVGRKAYNTTRRHPKRFKCDHCGNSFTAQRHLYYHVKSIHNKIKDHFCSHCPRAFSGKSALSRHVLQCHTDIRNFQCERCPFKCLNKAHLRIHVRNVHEQMKLFHCKLCSDKSFKSRYTLNQHITIFHQKKRDFVCSICGNTFGTNPSLITHMRKVHENIKDYRCTHCKKVLEDKQSLAAHLDEEHGGEPNYKCDHCSMKTMFNSSLRKHLRTVHSEKGINVSTEKKEKDQQFKFKMFTGPPDELSTSITSVITSRVDGNVSITSPTTILLPDGSGTVSVLD